MSPKITGNNFATSGVDAATHAAKVAQGATGEFAAKKTKHSKGGLARAAKKAAAPVKAAYKHTIGKGVKAAKSGAVRAQLELSTIKAKASFYKAVFGVSLEGSRIMMERDIHEELLFPMLLNPEKYRAKDLEGLEDASQRMKQFDAQRKQLGKIDSKEKVESLKQLTQLLNSMTEDIRKAREHNSDSHDWMSYSLALQIELYRCADEIGNDKRPQDNAEKKKEFKRKIEDIGLLISNNRDKLTVKGMKMLEEELFTLKAEAFPESSLTNNLFKGIGR